MIVCVRAACGLLFSCAPLVGPLGGTVAHCNPWLHGPQGIHWYERCIAVHAMFRRVARSVGSFLGTDGVLMCVHARLRALCVCACLVMQVVQRHQPRCGADCWLLQRRARVYLSACTRFWLGFSSLPLSSTFVGLQSHCCLAVQTDNNDAYANIASMFSQYGITFCFTCLEMQDSEQPASCSCGPFELVEQTKV